MTAFVRPTAEAPGAPRGSVAVAILVQAPSGVFVHHVGLAIGVIVKPVAVIRPTTGSQSMAVKVASRNVSPRDRTGTVHQAAVMSEADIAQPASLPT